MAALAHMARNSSSQKSVSRVTTNQYCKVKVRLPRLACRATYKREGDLAIVVLAHGAPKSQMPVLANAIANTRCIKAASCVWSFPSGLWHSVRQSDKLTRNCGSVRFIPPGFGKISRHSPLSNMPDEVLTLVW